MAATKFVKHPTFASRYDVVRNGKVVGTVTGVGYDRPRAWVAEKPGAPAATGRRSMVGYATRADAASTL